MLALLKKQPGKYKSVRTVGLVPNDSYGSTQTGERMRCAGGLGASAMSELANENNQSSGVAPPAREASPGVLPALLTLALGFAIALALYAAFDASARMSVHIPSAAGLSQ